MKKILNTINKNKKNIFSFIVIIVLIGFFMHVKNSLYAATNPEYYNPPDGFQQWLESFFGGILNIGAGVLGKPFAAIVNLVNVVLFILMYSIFVPSGISNGLAFPFPDQIIFNGISFLDPNFINPVNDNTAIVNIVYSLVQKLYYSFFTLAGTVFVLAAVVIGIKLAFSSLASEKAQYKTAIKYWITGISALFLMHFVLTGMFALNEQICIAASKFCADVRITINGFDFVPLVGSTIKGLINFIGGIFGAPSASDFADIEVQGYGGILLKFAAIGILQSDLVYSIGLAIILGQTFSLIITYLKRVFYCIILGMVAPLVVAMDTIQKVVTGKDSGVLKNWFQNMVAIIFSQSFQAVFLCVSTIIIGEISNQSGEVNTDLIEGIIAVVSLNAIMKFDKLFKELLGIRDSRIMGGFNENAMKSFAAIKSGISLAKRSAEPFKKRKEAKLRYNAASKRRDKAVKNLAELENKDSQTSTNNSAGEQVLGDSRSVGVPGTASNAQIINAMNNLSRALEKNTASKESDNKQKLIDEISSAEADMVKARADQRAESLRAFTRLGTTLGSVGFGWGATGNMEGAVTAGNVVDVPLDAMTDRAVNRGVYGNTSRKFEGKTDEFTEMYKKRGFSEAEARAAAEKSISNITSQLNNEIPEVIGHMIKDITTEAFKGAADVASRKGKKYSKEVAKKLYSSDNIDNI